MAYPEDTTDAATRQMWDSCEPRHRLLINDNEREQCLNKRELTSVRAMIAYVASKSDLTELSVKEIVLKHFSTPSLEEMPSARYDDAIKYLVDIEIPRLN